MKLKNCLILVFVISLLIITKGYAFGMVPSTQIIDFDSNLKEKLSFKIMNTEHRELELKIYSRGELQQYVNLEKKSIKIKENEDSAEIPFKLDIPSSARKPGANLIEIVVEEVPSEYSMQTAIGAKIALVHQLILSSPLKGKYLFAKLNVPSLNSFEAPIFTYTLSNLGSETIDDAYIELEIFDESLHSLGLQKINIDIIEPGEKRKQEVLYRKSLAPGDYRLSSIIYYGNEKIREELTFGVGGPYIEIEGIWAPNFILGQINEIGLSVRNVWSQEIKNVNAEITVADSRWETTNKFNSLSYDIGAFEQTDLIGYWNTKSLSEGKYFLKAKLNYEGAPSERDFEVFISKNEMKSSFAKISGGATAGESEGFNPSVSTLIVAIIILIIINVLLFMYIKRKKENNSGETPPQTNF